MHFCLRIARRPLTFQIDFVIMKLFYFHTVQVYCSVFNFLLPVFRFHISIFTVISIYIAAYFFSDVLINFFHFISFVSSQYQKKRQKFYRIIDVFSTLHDRVGENDFRLLEIW